MTDHHTGRPMATFDPAPYGIHPVPLAGTVAAVELALDALEDAKAAIAGCTTPLNLTRAFDDLHKIRLATLSVADELTRAADIIESDVPLSGTFPGEAPWHEARKTVVLSPRQILVLADRAEAEESGTQVTYREVINAADNPKPSIITREESWVAAALRRQEQEQLQARILEDIESRPCPSCGAIAGAYCRTSGGNVGGPHAARRKASPLAAEYPADAKVIRREDVEAAERFQQAREGRERAVEVGNEDRELLAEVVGELADHLRPRY